MPYDYKQLKAGRERMGLNRSQLARDLGVTGAAIGLIEKGERQSPETIKAYANRVKVRMQDIVISDEEFDAMRTQDEAQSQAVMNRKRREPVGAQR